MRTLPALSVLLLAALLAAAEPREKEPTATPEREALLKLVKATQARDATAVQQAYEEIARDFAGKEVADEAAFYYALFHFGQRDLDKGQALLLSLKRSGRKNAWVSRAIIRLADLARQRGDERAMIGYLEEALQAQPTPTARNLMDTLDTRQEAYVRLGHHYRDKGDFKKALDYFTRWQPHSWCGNCLDSMQAEREREIALCRMHLGDHVAVAGDCWKRLRKENWLSSFDSWSLWRLYTDAGQVADLRGILDAYEKGRKEIPEEEKHLPPPTQGLRGLLRVGDLAGQKDIGALVALCQESIREDSLDVSEGGKRDLSPSAAAEALANFGGTEVEAIQSALDKGPKVTGWLIYALGRSSTPAALEVLQKVAEQDKGEDVYRRLNITYALALKGEPGKKVLQRLAKRESEMGETAQYWLERRAEPAWPAATWPRPKAGSLPKTLPG